MGKNFMGKIKNHITVLLMCVAFAACESGGSGAYHYETDPQYTWGQVLFYGNYYALENNNLNNVLSVSLMTQGLVNNSGTLKGTGQYLQLEDVFVSPTDTILPEGTYTFSDSGEPHTITPGKNYTNGNMKYPIGSRLYYYEKNTDYSKTVFIKSGTITVVLNGEIFTISADLLTSEGTRVTGNFTGKLPHYDESLHKVKQHARFNFPADILLYEN